VYDDGPTDVKPLRSVANPVLTALEHDLAGSDAAVGLAEPAAGSSRSTGATASLAAASTGSALRLGSSGANRRRTRTRRHGDRRSRCQCWWPATSTSPTS
jgi:hypothetical protein